MMSMNTLAVAITPSIYHIHLVNTSVEEESNIINEDEDSVLHGTKILLNLVSPWAFSYRVVCADSYFTSVTSSEALKDIVLHFIGFVKTATKKFIAIPF